MADPWAHGLLKHLWGDPSWWDISEECLQTCWELEKAKEPPSNMVPLESKVLTDMWHVLPDTWTEAEELMWGEERHNLPDTSKDGWMHSTSRPQDVVHFPWCNTADTTWYMRLPTDPPLVEPKVEMQLGQCEEEDATLPNLWQIICFHIEAGRNVYQKKSNTVLVGQTQYLAGQSGKKRRNFTSWLHKL